MIASLRAENLKTRKRLANWILVAILLAILVLLSYVVTYLVLSHPPRRFESPVPASVLKRETYPENLIPTVLSSMSTFGAAIMIIFGGLSAASEYGWLTVQTLLVQRPGRTAVLLGKVANVIIVTLVVALLVLAGAALTSYVLVSIDNASSSWPTFTTLIKGFAALWLELGLWAFFGLFLGVALRSTAGAIGVGLTYLFVIEGLIARLLSDTEGVKEVLKFLPGINTSAVNATFPFTFRNPNGATPLVSGGRGTITLLIYVVAFIVASILIFQNRDVTGG